ncbi:putative pyrroloquinoline-quinone binding quinoprotein [Stackebrandtia endophytica]|uniref:Putative pyrroloquinoline-quinone binding quinoprotein n=1 Tax=Stackebrandtia endophytica TaxID=1496996 RepID=A0A543AXF3_9ACTN|nr:Hsp70 family protein [Stackebrandtia endophytica]TQL77233.1 putative pyrroloquinoline-quinone binding quinoprotein [Stackebrandtia endophytica]
MQTPVWLAVDLGTTHTVAVVGRGDQRPRPLLFDDSPLLPSGVFLSADGTMHTGKDAWRLARTEPDRFEPYPKRRIDDGTVLLGDRELSISQLFATILRRVASEAVGSGMSPRGVVLTHPADWGPVRRQVLEQAATEAGFDDVRLLPEPIAAAAYCTRELERDIPDKGSVAIFDFGGGTFDVAVVQRDPDSSTGWRTLAVGGLDDLGGLDVDNTLVGHLGQLVSDRDSALWQRIHQPDSPVDRRDRQAFWTEVRAVKEMLSRASTAPVALPGDGMVNLHLTRDELTRLADPLIARAVDETRRTLQRAEVEPSKLSVLLLVGGSSRMPQVATSLHAKFGIAPLVPDQPELPVAYGALAHAMTEAPQPPSTSSPRWAGVEGVSPPGGQPSPPVSSPPGDGWSSPPVSTPPVSTPPTGWSPPTSGPPTSGGPTGNWGTTPPTVTQGFPVGSSGVNIPTGTPQQGRRVFALPMIMALVTVLIVVLAIGGTMLVRGFDGAGDDLAGDKDDQQTAVVGPETESTGTADLGPLFDYTITGSGAASITATEDTVVVGEVSGGQTTFTAFSADGEELWSKSHELEPTGLSMTVVGDLILVDAESSATDEGETMRAVVSLEDGKLLWKKKWSDFIDIAVYGTDLIVEQQHGIYDNAVIKLDLTTGKQKWSHAGPDGLWLLETRVAAATYWDEGEPGDGEMLPFASAMYDNLVAGDKIVDLNPDTGDGRVRDAGNGKSIVSGSVPLEGEEWTVFEDLIIGKLSDDASPGRATLAAYSLSNLDKVWDIPLDAGHDIGTVKPCGPTLVCAEIDTSGNNETHHTVAVDITSGEEAWSFGVDWSTDESWYATNTGIIFGNHVFDTVEAAVLIDFNGTGLLGGETFVFVNAVRDGMAVFNSAVNDGINQVQQISIVDTANGETIGTQSIGGSHRPHLTVMAGDLVAVHTSDNTVEVFSIPQG